MPDESKAGASPGEVDTGFTVYDVPVSPEDPNCSTFRGRRVTRGDWPFPAKPPYEADDEGKAVPDEQ